MTIVSGGQTGADRAALDAAMRLGLPCGGWCPAGRWAEDGRIPAVYPLRETPLADPAQRTEWNVRDSDATLILAFGRPEGGTRRTLGFAGLIGRRCWVASPARADHLWQVRDWLHRHPVRVLNVAGPRESEEPGIHRAALCFVRAVLLP